MPSTVPVIVVNDLAHAVPVSLSGVSAVSGTVAVTSTVPLMVTDDTTRLDDEGFPYVNPNVPGADIATGDKQTAIINALAGLQVALQALHVVVDSAPSTTLNVNVAQPAQAQVDADIFDDDGVRFVNPNVPGADIATGDRQQTIINLLQSLIGTPGSQADNGKARTLANGAFVAAATGAQVAGQISRTQLWNQSTTKRLILKGFTAGCATATLIRTGVQSVQLTASSGLPGPSKLGGGATSVAVDLRSDSAAASGIGTPAFFYFIGASQPGQIILQEPIVLPPGYGFTMDTQALNVILYTSWEWTEESIV